jgi:hypothetical protein
MIWARPRDRSIRTARGDACYDILEFADALIIGLGQTGDAFAAGIPRLQPFALVILNVAALTHSDERSLLQLKGAYSPALAAADPDAKVAAVIAAASQRICLLHAPGTQNIDERDRCSVSKPLLIVVWTSSSLAGLRFAVFVFLGFSC